MTKFWIWKLSLGIWGFGYFLCPQNQTFCNTSTPIFSGGKSFLLSDAVSGTPGAHTAWGCINDSHVKQISGLTMSARHRACERLCDADLTKGR